MPVKEKAFSRQLREPRSLAFLVDLSQQLAELPANRSVTAILNVVEPAGELLGRQPS